MYNTRKFDVRVWAVVTDDFRIYFYKSGYIRTASSNYDLQNRNNYVHLTNQCLQIKDKENYGTHEEGNTLSFQELQEYIDANTSHGLNIEEHLLPRMMDMCIDTFLSVRHELNPERRPNVFELFGFDFLLDEDFRVWLIECNTNPYLGTPCAYMKEMLP